MKFKSITLHNFMRYKGDNKIEFSCDEEKNVTIVLGDNTVGKTTIAQAFRWGLYGDILIESGKNKNDYVLLNNEVISLMDANSYSAVSVEIEFIQEKKLYALKREITYARMFPKHTLREVKKKRKLGIIDEVSREVLTEIDDKNVESVIQEFFPKDLSHYFLFDGERWSDTSIKGVKEDIKESVHKLTGLTAVKQGMNHLKDMGRNSVMGLFKSKISGSGAMYDNLRNDLERDERRIDSARHEMKRLKEQLQLLENNLEGVEQQLADSLESESKQKQYKQTKRLMETQKHSVEVQYKMLVDDFSQGAYEYLAVPMMDAALDVLKRAEVVRKDIPYIRQATIDYLLDRKECICGANLLQNSCACERLKEEREYLPPADIGSLLGDFEKEAVRWKRGCSDFEERMTQQGRNVDKEQCDFDETYEEWKKIEDKIENNSDCDRLREKKRTIQNEIRKCQQSYGSYEGQIEATKRHMEKLEREMEAVEARTNSNRIWRERLEAANELYNRFSVDFTKQELATFEEINQNVQINFQKMFNAKDKKIKLDNNYNIGMYYKTETGYAEEKNLSEGEKIARNFAFIVTIMEYSKKKKQQGDKMADTLPIVLDGPFSKLGEDNISLVASVLPGIAEQVILFMLKKDWVYTNLDDYVGARYFIDKESESGSASIKREG